METTELTPQNESVSKKYFLYGFLGLFITVIIVFALYSVSNLLGNWTLPSASNPSPSSSTTTVPVKKLSAIATDSSFLEAEKNLENLNKDNASVDLSEPKLSLPVLEMNVNFEK